MKTKEWKYTDKSDWKRGPWDEEPDKMQWEGPDGTPCLIVRGPSGALCGYAGVSEGHPLFGIDYCGIDSIGAHGGLTYSAFCAPGEGERGICHIVDPGENDRIWWLGFDCAHLGDYAPGFDHDHYPEGDRYRTLEYVKSEAEDLARQLVRIAGPVPADIPEGETEGTPCK